MDFGQPAWSLEAKTLAHFALEEKVALFCAHKELVFGGAGLFQTVNFGKPTCRLGGIKEGAEIWEGGKGGDSVFIPQKLCPA